MIEQALLAGACIYTVNKLYDRERRNIKRKWKFIMQENKLINDRNHTFNIARINATEYGFLLIVGIPDGFSFDELEKKLAILESNLKGTIELEHNKYNGWITMRLIKKPLKNLEYIPIKTKPHELYVGYTYNQHVTVDFNTFPHLLIAGINGSGKTRGLYCILTNLFHNHDESEIEVYMSQIGKTDLLIYRSCPQIKTFARSPEASLKMYQQVYFELLKREKEIEKLMVNGILNIEDYNRLMTEQMRYIYVVSDEFSLYMPDATDSKQEKALKEECLDILKKLIKLGRAYGIFVIMALQKTTNDQMPQLLKSQVNTKICFKQTDVHSSRNIIDCDDALKLERREAILLSDGKYRIKTPYIDEKIIKQYLAVKKQQPVKVQIALKPNIQDGVINDAN